MPPAWHNANASYPNRAFRCGHCAFDSGSTTGYHRGGGGGEDYFPLGDGILICVRCQKPTYFEGDRQVPAAPYGVEVQYLPPSVQHVYAEARNCMLVEAYTASALMCRKLLMNVAHTRGATAGMKFVEYVNFLVDGGYVSPTSREWVDHIRDKANEGTHEIPQVSREDAADLIAFAETLLKTIFEFPARVAAKSK